MENPYFTAAGYLTTRQVAERLGVHRTYVSKLVNAGDLPVVRATSPMGSQQNYIPVDAVEAWEAQRDAERRRQFEEAIKAAKAEIRFAAA